MFDRRSQSTRYEIESGCSLLSVVDEHSFVQDFCRSPSLEAGEGGRDLNVLLENHKRF